MRRTMNIGTTSLILIFIVLCLATFGLLSLSTARGEWNLAEKNAGAVRTYYEADAKGERFVAMADRVLQEVREQGLTGDARENMLTERLEGYHQADGIVRADIGMDFGQALCIELKITEDSDYQIQSWNVYNREDYEIDHSIPVWTGDGSSGGGR